MSVDISFTSLLLAGTLLLFNLAITRYLALGTEQALGIATLRMVLQLTAVGFLLDSLLATQNSALAIVVFVAMMAFATREVRARSHAMIKGPMGWVVSGLGLNIAASLMTLFLLRVAIQPDPWWHMQYAVPLFGMLLGNAMTGVALTLHTLLVTIEREKGAIENSLARGHTIHQALLRPVRQAVTTGTMPAINAMAATGVVFLPGLMVGQILSGVPPLTAIKYQMLLMILLTVGTALAVIICVTLTALAVTDTRQRLRLDRIYTRPSS